MVPCYKYIKRNRMILCCSLAFIIFIGLLSRSKNIQQPAFFAEYAGDTLWASMVYIIFSLVIPKIKIRYVFIIALLFSFLIEFSQMLEYTWLVKLRATPLYYILGQGFVWSDLICYTIGCIGIACLDFIWLRRRISNE